MDILLFDWLSELEKSNDDTFISAFSEYIDSLNALYRAWFPAAKPYSDEHITNQVLQLNVAPKDYKAWIKYEMTCLIRSAKRIYHNIIHCQADQLHLVASQVTLLREYIKDSKSFLKTAATIIGNNTPRCFRNYTVDDNNGSVATRYNTILFLRQATELYIKRVFGMHTIQSRGELQKLPPEVFIAFIDDSGVENKFPIRKATLKNIYNWTKAFAHSSVMPYVWEIEWCHFMLEPMLYNFLSRVKIKKNCIRKIHAHLRNQYGEDIVIAPDSPAKYALLIE